MNCEMCKFRLAVADSHGGHGHEHGHGHAHEHGHHHGVSDPYARLEDYHQRIWQAP
jgi:sirohydrochlorin cobaltochelatase